MDNMQDFTTGSIPKKMLRFMLPILVALILQAMYSAVDLLIVGKFGTTAGISAVTTGSQITGLATFTVCALTTGVTVLMGRYLGQNRPERLPALLGSAVSFFALLGSALTVVLLVFARPLARLMQAPAEALDLTVQYIRICGTGFLFVVFYNIISSVFRGMGDSRLPLLFVGIACAVNIIGDLVLVAGFGMNVAGAAIATVGAQAVSVLLSLVIIRRKKTVRLCRADLRLGADVGQFLSIGTPLALQEILTSVSFMALCAFINRLGLTASSGYGVAQKIQSFVMLIPSAIMQSMACFVSQNVGACQPVRARKAMCFGMLSGGSIGVFIAYLAFFQGSMLAGMFSDDAAVIARAAEFLKGFAPEAVVTCILFSFMGYFNGYSRSFFVMAQGLAQSFLVRLPISYLMSIRPNASLTEIGLAAPTATVFGILLCFIYYCRMQRQISQNSFAEKI